MESKFKKEDVELSITKITVQEQLTLVTIGSVHYDIAMKKGEDKLSMSLKPLELRAIAKLILEMTSIRV